MGKYPPLFCKRNNFSAWLEGFIMTGIEMVIKSLNQIHKQKRSMEQ